MFVELTCSGSSVFLNPFQVVSIEPHEDSAKAIVVVTTPEGGPYTVDHPVLEVKEKVEYGLGLSLDRVGEITEDDIAAVENEIGMGCGAWDMVDHRELILACVKVVCRKTGDKICCVYKR